MSPITTSIFALIDNSIKDKAPFFELLGKVNGIQLADTLTALSDWELQAIRSNLEPLMISGYGLKEQIMICIVYAIRNEQCVRKNGLPWIPSPKANATVRYNEDPVYYDPYNIYNF